MACLGCRCCVTETRRRREDVVEGQEEEEPEFIVTSDGGCEHLLTTAVRWFVSEALGLVDTALRA